MSCSLIVKKCALTAIMLIGTASFANYSVSITEPSESRAYQRPAQNIDINIAVGNLKPTDTLEVTLNGQFIGANQHSLSIPTIDLNPNEYVIRAEVQDEAGRVVAQDSKTVYVIQNTHATKLRQAQEAKKQAIAQYRALPWYKRAYYTLRQDVETPKDETAK